MPLLSSGFLLDCTRGSGYGESRKESARGGETQLSRVNEFAAHYGISLLDRFTCTLIGRVNYAQFRSNDLRKLEHPICNRKRCTYTENPLEMTSQQASDGSPSLPGRLVLNGYN